MNRNELKTEAKYAIIDKLEEGYEGYLCDLHNEVFNMEMYTEDRNKAVEILDSLGAYSVIEEITRYEQDNFGEVNTHRLASPCDVLSMFWYIVGEEALAELGEDVPEFDELWNEELTEEECLVLIDRFTKKMEEEGGNKRAW